MDRVFHHILWDVAQIQLVLGLRRLEAQLWQGTEIEAADSQAAIMTYGPNAPSWTAHQPGVSNYIPSC